MNGQYMFLKFEFPIFAFKHFFWYVYIRVDTHLNTTKILLWYHNFVICLTLTVLFGVVYEIWIIIGISYGWYNLNFGFYEYIAVIKTLVRLI